MNILDIRWPMGSTKVLFPCTVDDGRQEALKRKYADMHRSLEFEQFDLLDALIKHKGVGNYDYYLQILRAGINRPRVFLRCTIQQQWMNIFNPWIANILKSNIYT